MTKEVKFQLSELLGIGMTLVVLGIGLAYGLQVMGDVKDDSALADCTNQPPESGYTTYVTATKLCTNGSDSLEPASTAYVAVTDSVTGVAKIPSKLPTIATVVVAAVILGILVTYLWARFR